MATNKGKTPVFPPYRFRGGTERNLYILRGHALYDEMGNRTSIDDYAGLVSFLFAHNALAFTETLSHTAVYPFLRESVEDPHATVSCTKKGLPTCITVSGARNSTRKIVPCTNWKDREYWKEHGLTPTFLKEMRDLYDYCAVGVHSSPGALGYALQLQSYTVNELNRHGAPNSMAQQFLWEHHVGGRCDTMVPFFVQRAKRMMKLSSLTWQRRMAHISRVTQQAHPVQW